VSLLVCVVLAGCAAENRGAVQAAGSDGQLTVVATMTVLAEFAEEVGGGHVTVTSLVPLGGDPHGYEPVPGDAAAVSEADVVIDNGMGLLPWFDALKTNVEGHLLVLAEEIEGDARTDREGRPDPHFWMSPAYAADYVTAIEEALATADPQGADHYRANAEAYRDHLTAVDQEVGEILGVVPAGTRHLVTYEDAYGYFADHYDFEVAGSVLGATTEEEPSAQHLRELVDLLADRDVAAVFPQATENPAVMEWLARDAGVELGEELFVDSLGDPGSGTETYAGLLRSNAKAIAEALGGGGDE
jgi:ABC-type Zn uptake system ZnuABC Zn-binding protein ZnuA